MHILSLFQPSVKQPIGDAPLWPAIIPVCSLSSVLPPLPPPPPLSAFQRDQSSMPPRKWLVAPSLATRRANGRLGVWALNESLGQTNPVTTRPATNCWSPQSCGEVPWGSTDDSKGHPGMRAFRGALLARVETPAERPHPPRRRAIFIGRLDQTWTDAW